MKRTLIALVALAALPLGAQQQPAPAPAPANNAKIVAVINGEVITREKLDQLYERLGTKMRAQYDNSGGRAAFLENYLRKRLLVQEALKAGLDKQPDVQADMEAAKEAALFDRYVRDVVAASIVTDAAIHKFYDEHPENFKTPEEVKVRHIVVVPTEVGPNRKTKGEALEKIQKIAAELHGQNVFPAGTDEASVRRIELQHFSDMAKKYSEDGAAPSGGDLGWVRRGMLDPQFEEAMFRLKKGVTSGIVETKFGYHLILVEDRKDAGTQSFAEAKPQIREFLMTEHQTEVVEAVAKLTTELRNTSKISVYNENLR